MSETVTTTHPDALSADRRPVKMRASRVLHSVARLLAKKGVTANAVSLASVGSAFLAALFLIAIPLLPTFVVPLSIAAAIAIFGRGLCNLLDGLIAIENDKATANGAFFNEAPDRVADALILTATGLAWRFDFVGLSAGLFLSLLAFGTAYVRALGKTLTGEDDFRGPMAKPHRIGVLCVLLPLLPFLPTALPGMEILLVILAGGTLYTIGTRTRHLLSTLNQPHS